MHADPRHGLAPEAKKLMRAARFIFWAVIVFLYTPLVALFIQALWQLFSNEPQPGADQTLWESISRAEFWIPLWTSLSVAIAAATLSAILGTAGALGFHRWQNKPSVWFQSLVMLPLITPEVVTGLSLLLLFVACRIELGFTTLVLAHASFSASFVFFTVLEQIKKLDPEIIEASQDLGATPAVAFRKVIFPNLVPGMIGGWIVAFTLSFDDFLISFFTSGASLTTLPLKIYSMMRIGVTPELNAMALVMIVFSSGAVLFMVAKEERLKWLVKQHG